MKSVLNRPKNRLTGSDGGSLPVGKKLSHYIDIILSRNRKAAFVLKKLINEQSVETYLSRVNEVFSLRQSYFKLAWEFALYS